MSSGRKYAELRLNDEKRQKIQVGDQIIFTKVDDKKSKLKVAVIDCIYAHSFVELLSKIPSNSAGSTSTDELLKSLRSIYPQDKENLYGTVCLIIRRLR